MKYKQEKLEAFIQQYLKKGKHLHIAIEQRQFVWDSRNVIQLLDSVCRGIPLGTIILGSGGIATGAESRKGEKVKKGVPVIYDGQQRMLSLKKVFVDHQFELPEDERIEGKKCMVWVDVDNFIDAVKSRGKERLVGEKDRNPSLLRFKYRGAEAGCYPFEIVPEDLVANCRNPGERIQKYAKERRQFGEASDHWQRLQYILRNKYPGKNENRVKKFILRKMRRCKISVCEIGKDTDMENLFLRINRAGQPVNDDEQYFAALKQRWGGSDGQLEEQLKGLWGSGTPFALLDAVHLLVYMAQNMDSLGEEGEVVLPRIRLRDFREDVVGKIKSMLKKKAIIKKEIRKCTESLSNAGGLKYGVHLINSRLMAMAMAGVIGSVLGKKEKTEKWKNLAKSLFVIDQSGVLSGQQKDKMSTRIFKRFWAQPFGEKMPRGVKGGFKWRSEKNPTDVLWLSVFQRFASDQKRRNFDVDHIIPHSWVKNQKGIASNLRKSINLLGNKWLVGSRKNREWQAVAPAQKKKEVKRNKKILFGRSLKYLKADRLLDITKNKFLKSKGRGDFAGPLLKRNKSIVRTVKKELGI